MYFIRMTFAKNVQYYNESNRLFGRKLILGIIIVLVASIAMSVWFFSISSLGNEIGNTEKYLPPNCYSINGKQICPPPKS